MKHALLAGFLLVVALPAGAAPANLSQQARAAALPTPLANYPNGPAMLQQALSQLGADVSITFLDKTYENDVYVKDPITGQKARVSCRQFKASSGYRVKMDPPAYDLNNQGLTVTTNFAKIKAEALAFKFMLGPCAWVGSGFGLHLTDVKLVFKAKPVLTFDEAGHCKLSWNNDPGGVAMSIGDLNIIGVQNDLDKLAKTAVREGFNSSMDAVFGSGLRGELQKVVVNTCGKGKH